jgi:hypothetical protein
MKKLAVTGVVIAKEADKMKVKNRIIITALAISLLFGLTAAAHADPTLTITETNAGATTSSTATGTYNSNTGVDSYSGTLGNISFTFAIGSTQPTLANFDLDADAGALGAAGGTLVITFTDTWTVPGLTGSLLMVNGNFNAGGSGSVDVQEAYNGNAFLDTGALTSTAFDASIIGPFPTPLTNPYTLTETATIVLGSDTIVSFDANDNAVPEPCSMLLVGSGLVGMAAYRRLKKAI